MAFKSWKLSIKGALVLSLGLGMSSVMPATMVQAETLSDVLIKAYRTSPQLRQNQAALRATDEGVAQARAGLRPQVSLNGSLGTSARTQTGGFSNAMSATLSASLLLFDGGGTQAAIESAKFNVLGSRAQLLEVEQSVLLSAVTAYLDVRRDLRFVGLAQNNITVIDQQVQAARDRFEVGEVTRTDVSQAQARLAQARSALASNQGALERSRQSFTAAVGSTPGRLSPPPRLPKLPATLQAANDISMQRHPSLISARHFETASSFDLKRARAGSSVSVSLNASAGYQSNANTRSGFADNDTRSLSLTAQKPLYLGGQISSLERQAQAVLEQRQSQIQLTARNVLQNVGFAWANLDVARASIRASQQQIRAAEIAFDGVKEEAKLGSRTTLDVLDAEQELLNARSNLASAQRDEYVAAYNLMAAIGLLNVRHLGLGVDPYNPELNYNAVQNAPYKSRQGAAVDRISKRWNK